MVSSNCRVCDVELNDDNSSPSRQKNGQYICKECAKEKGRLYNEENRDKVSARTRLYYEANQDKLKAYASLYRKENPEKAKANDIKAARKRGVLAFDENKDCTMYYGVHINEGVLKLYFNDVEVMPMNNTGYDFVCNNGWKIDGKSSFTGDKGYWKFSIKHNTIADYFFCVAYDNRKDKNIIHVWILPGDKFSHLVSARIQKNTVYKWAEYEQPIGKLSMCCDKMKSR